MKKNVTVTWTDLFKPLYQRLMQDVAYPRKRSGIAEAYFCLRSVYPKTRITKDNFFICWVSFFRLGPRRKGETLFLHKNLKVEINEATKLINACTGWEIESALKDPQQHRVYKIWQKYPGLVEKSIQAFRKWLAKDLDELPWGSPAFLGDLEVWGSLENLTAGPWWREKTRSGVDPGPVFSVETIKAFKEWLAKKVFDEDPAVKALTTATRLQKEKRIRRSVAAVNFMYAVARYLAQKRRVPFWDLHRKFHKTRDEMLLCLQPLERRGYVSERIQKGRHMVLAEPALIPLSKNPPPTSLVSDILFPKTLGELLEQETLSSAYKRSPAPLSHTLSPLRS